MPKIQQDLRGEKQSSSPSPICSPVSLENVEFELAFGEDGSMSCFARCALFFWSRRILVRAPMRGAPP